MIFKKLKRVLYSSNPCSHNNSFIKAQDIAKRLEYSRTTSKQRKRRVKLQINNFKSVKTTPKRKFANPSQISSKRNSISVKSRSKILDLGRILSSKKAETFSKFNLLSEIKSRFLTTSKKEKTARLG